MLKFLLNILISSESGTILQDIPDPTWMLRPQLHSVHEKLAELDLTFDALVMPQHLLNLHYLLQYLYDLAVVLNHGTKLDIANGVFQSRADN